MTESHYTVPCNQCNGQMVLRHGRYGRFYGCSNYPRCLLTMSERDWEKWITVNIIGEHPYEEDALRWDE